MGKVDMRKEVYAQGVSEGTQLWVLAKAVSVEQLSSKMHSLKTDCQESRLVSFTWFFLQSIILRDSSENKHLLALLSLFTFACAVVLRSQTWFTQVSSEKPDLQQHLQAVGIFRHTHTWESSQKQPHTVHYRSSRLKQLGSNWTKVQVIEMGKMGGSSDWSLVSLSLRYLPILKFEEEN